MACQLDYTASYVCCSGTCLGVGSATFCFDQLILLTNLLRRLLQLIEALKVPYASLVKKSYGSFACFHFFLDPESSSIIQI